MSCSWVWRQRQLFQPCKCFTIWAYYNNSVIFPQANDSNKQRVADVMGTSDYRGGGDTPVARRSASKNHLNDSMSSLNSVNSDTPSDSGKQGM